MQDHFAELSDEECIEYATQCIAETVPIPDTVRKRLEELGIYTVLAEINYVN